MHWGVHAKNVNYGPKFTTSDSQETIQTGKTVFLALQAIHNHCFFADWLDEYWKPAKERKESDLSVRKASQTIEPSAPLIWKPGLSSDYRCAFDLRCQKSQPPGRNPRVTQRTLTSSNTTLHNNIFSPTLSETDSSWRHTLLGKV